MTNFRVVSIIFICVLLVESIAAFAQCGGDTLVHGLETCVVPAAADMQDAGMGNGNAVNDLVEFLKSTWGTLNFWIIIILLVFNLVVGAIQLCVPFGQNRREMRLAEHKFKIDKKHK